MKAQFMSPTKVIVDRGTALQVMNDNVFQMAWCVCVCWLVTIVTSSEYEWRIAVYKQFTNKQFTNKGPLR